MCYEKTLGYSGALERTATVLESVLSHRYCVSRLVGAQMERKHTIREAD